MNVRTALLALFVGLTIVFASTTAYESSIRTTTTSTSISMTTQDMTITTTTTYRGPLTSYSSVQTVIAFGAANCSNIPWCGQVFYRAGNGWNFSVTFRFLDLNTVNQNGISNGQTIYAYANLTNISGQTQRVNEMNPLINPVLYCRSGPCGNPGDRVWAWDPSGATNFTRNFDSGQWEFSGPYPIPVSPSAKWWGGIPEGSLTLSIWPLIGPSGQSLTVNATVGASLMINETIGVS